MPNPMFSGEGPYAGWYQDFTSWANDQGRPRELAVPDYDPSGIGISTGDMDMINKILIAMLGVDKQSPRWGAYRSGLAKTREKSKDAVKSGTKEAKKRRDPVGEADRVAYGQ